MIRALLLWMLVAIGLGVFAVRVLVPTAIGVQVITIETPSMGDALPVGSLAYIEAHDTYAVDDVVTFGGSGSQPITHRVVAELGGGFYRVQGDANNAPDAELITDNNIYGMVVWSAPWLGVVTKILSTVPVMAFILLLAIAILWWGRSEPMAQIQPRRRNAS